MNTPKITDINSPLTNLIFTDKYAATIEAMRGDVHHSINKNPYSKNIMTPLHITFMVNIITIPYNIPLYLKAKITAK
jgi:hypothetical protein